MGKLKIILDTDSIHILLLIMRKQLKNYML